MVLIKRHHTESTGKTPYISQSFQVYLFPRKTSNPKQSKQISGLLIEGAGTRLIQASNAFTSVLKLTFWPDWEDAAQGRTGPNFSLFM